MPPRIQGWTGMLGRPARPSPPPPPRRDGISLWGAPTAGKSTFAAALAVALEKHPDQLWRLRGVDRRSAEELGTMRDALVQHGKFPVGTMDPADYNWEIVNPDPRAGNRGLFGLPRRDKTVRIPLHLRDAPGRHANPERWRDTQGARDLVDTIASSAGIIYLYDPVQEAEFGDAYLHTGSLIAQLDERAGGGRGGLLPHYLAVCLAKFDDDRVFRSARAANVVDYDYTGDGSPYVETEGAEAFFRLMCRFSPNPAAQELPPLLQRHFHPDRIKFYVTSAIGFYVNPRTNRFERDDFRNVLREHGKPKKIRGAIHPINVMEPVLWLTENLKREQR